MELRIKQSLAELAPPRLHPRSVLTRCHQCGGTGQSLIRYLGRVRESPCTNCAGRGTIVGEA